ncbi:MAG: DUF4290 domain-containing protein [Rikenellaceae bacterium]
MKSTTLNVPLLLPEYGRIVQRMVKYLLTIEDREKRNEQARIVIATMANVYPHAKRDTQEFKNMLYDHLFMISGFALDIDCEFEHPLPEQFSPTPQRVPYSQQGIVRKQYGALLPQIAREIAKIEDKDTQREMAENLVKFMRQKSYDYNQEYPSNELVIADLYDMSNGEIKLEASVFEGVHLNTHRSKQNANKNRQNGNKNHQKNRQNFKAKKQH